MKRTALALTAVLVSLAASIPVLAQPTGAYPSSKHGGNYMHNFYCICLPLTLG